MTKRRTSIRGRGAEILFGDPAPVEMEPRALEPVPQEIEVLEAEDVAAESAGMAWLEEDETLERALFEEAQDSAPRADNEEAPDQDWLSGPPPDPAMELAMIEEAFAAEEPPEPVAEVPIPTLEETMEERVRAEEMALYEPPPPEVSDVSSGVLPPKPRRVAPELNLEMSLARDIQEPEQKVERYELPDRPLTDEERQAVLGWWGNARIRAMSDEIDDTYAEVRRKVGENESIAVEAFNLLLKARDILIRREAERIAQAEYYIQLVQARLKRATESETMAKKAQWPLLAWGLFAGVAFLVLLILAGQGLFQSLFKPASQADSLVEMDIFLSAMLWGGIGGAVAVLYSLFKHVGQRDFDSQYIISYVGKPFMGLIVGATVYMVLALVVRALGLFPAGSETAEGVVAPSIAPGVVYLVAWAAGFKENRLLEIVDNTWNQLFGGKEEEGEEAAPAT